MIVLQVTIQNEVGLHARPATLLVQCAGQYKSAIRMRKVNGETTPINAKSIIHVLTLGVRKGEDVQIIFDGEDEDSAALAMRQLVEADFPHS